MMRLRLLVLCTAVAVTTPSFAGATTEDHTWLRTPTVMRGPVEEALARITAMSPRDASLEAEALLVEREGFSPGGRIVAEFLIAAALEHSGEIARAKLAYASVLRTAAASDFGIAADGRVKWLDISSGDFRGHEKYFSAVAKEPRREGWFVVGKEWVWTSSVRAGLQGLVTLRGDRASFRLFEFLRARSTFPRPYAYLFILLAVGIGVKVLALPLQVKAAIQAARLRRLQPEIQQIQRTYSDNPLEAQRHVQALMGGRGFSFAPGCAVGLLDMMFVIWGLLTLRDYAPQLALDGAQFWSVPDVTKPSGLILCLWIGLSFLQGLYMSAVQGMALGQAIAFGLFSGLIFAAIAWYGEWPAYVMIFWGLLTLMGVVLNMVLLPFCRSAAQ